MKTYFKPRKGFTLIELLTAVAITSALIAILIGMTRMTMDTWKESNDRARAGRQAKEALEIMARDLEGIVIRNGNKYEWLFAKMETSGSQGPSNAEIKNPIEFGFLTTATDRYNGQIGNEQVDKGGDISTALYRLVYKDQLNGEFPVYSLYRKLVNPDETFDKYLAQEKIEGVTPSEQIIDSENFLAENIYNLTVTLVFEYPETSGNGTIMRQRRIAVMDKGSSSKEVSIKGDRIDISPVGLKDANGRDVSASASLVSAELGVLVLNDSGMRGLNKKKFNESTFNKYLKENSHYYTKSVIMPRP